MTTTACPAPVRTLWLYRRAEAPGWEVGYFDTSGGWQHDSTHPTPEQAAGRVHWLNGGKTATVDPDLLARAELEIMRLEHLVDQLNHLVRKWQATARRTTRRSRELHRRGGRR